ncbi:hypothetical protein O181_018953 [Austropuccinia psidii MF-1]|uniref:Uncharacterized protein n=1 Tax=Austropuccinia psidii MF-1 TaxID=1389203 RepID=A0A9Q3C8S6_9BASI|nr:hypothetical protein [Austropuccinia psidii MF-1]
MSDNVLRQENIETSSTVTSIIAASTVNSEHNSTVIITQNNHPEPIYSELINLDISNTLQKNKEQVLTPQAAPKKLTNYAILKLIILFHLQTELKPPQEALVKIYKASQKAYDNALKHKEYQILSDLWKNCLNYYLTVRKFLGHPNTCKLPNGWHPLMEKKNMTLLTAEWRKNNPPPPKQVPKIVPEARSSNSSIKKQPQAQNKGKGKAPAKKPYSQGYRIPKIQQDAMENGFQMARIMMEVRKKEKA